tara:strand:- start:7184 stop:7342 length:159 start_codon:yes stop_codon:yes gene_type:complete
MLIKIPDNTPVITILRFAADAGLKLMSADAEQITLATAAQNGTDTAPDGGKA